MDIIVDANIIFAILIRKGITERVLLADEIHPYAPEYIFAELKKHESDVLELSKRSRLEFELLIDVLERRIELIPLSEFKHYLKEAEALLEDKDDAVYLAVCIAKNLPLWSNDGGFAKQKKVKIYTTQDLIWLLRLE